MDKDDCLVKNESENANESTIKRLEKIPIMNQALKALETLSRDPEVRALAKKREDYLSEMNSARLEGIAEAEEKIIKNMFKKEFSPEKISNILELDLNKVLEYLRY